MDYIFMLVKLQKNHLILSLPNEEWWMFCSTLKKHPRILCDYLLNWKTSILKGSKKIGIVYMFSLRSTYALTDSNYCANLFTGLLTLKAPISKNGIIQSNNSKAVANELFERVWPFYGVDTKRFNKGFVANLC